MPDATPQTDPTPQTEPTAQAEATAHTGPTLQLEPTAQTVSDVVAWYDGWLAHRARTLRVPGVQVAIRRHGELLLSVAYGSADLGGRGSASERPVPLTPRHLFRIASHSKTFTAVAVLQLAESDALRLDDTVGRWLPELVDTAPPVAARTLRQLLSHGGGISRDGHRDHWDLGEPFPDREQLLAIASGEGDVFPADRDFKYSNIAFGLLGLVIGAASGEPYGAHVAAHVVAPLGLADTGPEYVPDRAGDHAVGYSALALGDRVPVEHVDTGDLAAATGFYSTAEDLTAYFSAHLPGDDRLLSEPSKRAMRRREWVVEDGGYGLGLMISTAGGRTLYGHGGGYPGHITRSLYDPESGLVLSVLTNAVDGPAEELANAFFSVLALATGPAPDRPTVDEPHPPAAAPDDVDPARFPGRFATLWGVHDVVLLGGRLFELAPDRPDPAKDAVPLAIVDATTLRITERSGYGSPGETLRYTFTADGSVESVQGGSVSVPLETWRATTGTLDRIPAPRR